MDERDRRISFPVLAAAIFGLLANLQLSSGALQAQEPPEDLRITIIDGDGFTNNIKKHTPREPIVEVRDRNNSPVPGATVIFALPNGGASGTFANGGRLITVVTDQAGRASTVFRPNSVAGTFKLNVTASANGHTATASLSQTNSLTATSASAASAAGGAAGGISGTTIGIIVGVVAAAAIGTAVGVVKATGGSGKSATVSVGAPTVQ